ncbi:copper chaperone PCu(A)C [Piscinibacter sp.]|uniref:copper chaperone PCu(A)C n=1 Tax=Piscinibacter sp. TaxID=1903157 RepID=UPI002BE126AD|nr:copper chaperone PCu(A)C [Albitalea sp.]HUG23094.1 copper chaperone PCu(A)C [Albitalea sp.]
MKRRFLIVGVAGAAAAALAYAHSFKRGGIEIGHPYARATATGQPTGGAYLTLTNKGPADRLLSVSANVGERVELHSMTMEGDVMRMRQVDTIDLAAGKTVELKPGGLHIMLLGLKAPLNAGDTFPMTLTFEKAGTIEVVVNVEAVQAAPMKHDMKH